MQPSGDVLARGGDLNFFLFAFQTLLLPVLRVPFWNSLTLHHPARTCRFGRWGPCVLGRCGMSVAVQVSHGPCRASRAYRRLDALFPRLAPLPRLPQASPPGLPAPASLLRLQAPNTPALPLAGGPNPACSLAASTYREKMKLLTVLLLLSLYQAGTVLLTFLWGWLKVAPEIFSEEKKKEGGGSAGQGGTRTRQIDSRKM